MPNPGNDPKVDATNRRRASYTYGAHWGPHDIETTEISSGKTRRKIAFDLGLSFRVTPRGDVQDGITAAQFILSRCWFNEPTTERGLECLLHYRRTWQQKLNQFSSTPVHDWASHGADAFRGLAVRHRTPVAEKEKQKKQQQQSVGQWT